MIFCVDDAKIFKIFSRNFLFARANYTWQTDANSQLTALTGYSRSATNRIVDTTLALGDTFLISPNLCPKELLFLVGVAEHADRISKWIAGPRMAPKVRDLPAFEGLENGFGCHDRRCGDRPH